jgi:hypothetical protein
VTTGGNYPNIEALAVFIARSQIVVPAEPRKAMPVGGFRPLPAGFDEVDVAILEWIAAEARRFGRGVPRL